MLWEIGKEGQYFAATGGKAYWAEDRSATATETVATVETTRESRDGFGRIDDRPKAKEQWPALADGRKQTRDD